MPDDFCKLYDRFIKANGLALKNIAQIEHSRHRSVTGFTVNLMAGLGTD